MGLGVGPRAPSLPYIHAQEAPELILGPGSKEPPQILSTYVRFVYWCLWWRIFSTHYVTVVPFSWTVMLAKSLGGQSFIGDPVYLVHAVKDMRGQRRWTPFRPQPLNATSQKDSWNIKICHAFSDPACENSGLSNITKSHTWLCLWLNKIVGSTIPLVNFGEIRFPRDCHIQDLCETEPQV